MAMLEVDHLQKIYTTRFGASQVQALTDVTFSVEKGEYVAIMGESGSGKTTLLNILAALDKPTRGEVRLNGKLLSSISEKALSAFRRDNLGFVFQDFNLLDTFSIRDNIFLPLVLAGCPYREMENRLGPIAQKLGIGGILSKFPYEVSGGQKQRAAVARALITRPQLILADEPTGALDSRATDSLLRLFGEINEDGQTILMVTHSVKAASHAGRVMFIKDGEVFHQLYRGLDGTEGFVSSVSFTESDALIASPATFQVMVVEDYNRMLGRSETLAPGEALLECTRGNYEGDTLRLLDETFAIKARISDGLGAGQALASIYDYYCLVVDSMDTLRRLDSEQQAAYGDRASAIRTSMSFALLPASPQLSEQVAALLRSQADADGFTSVAERTELRENLMTLYGGLLFVGLFLGLLFTMAMILIIYYKQITEGYEDRERYRIMRKVGLSRREIRRSISSQILIVFFLPLAAAGLHVAFAFPGIVTMFRALSMTNVTLIAGCALGSFAGFAALYGAVYLLTARVYYRIVSE